MEFRPGTVYSTRSLRLEGEGSVFLEGKLQPKVKSMVLLLDVVDKKINYTKWHAIDALNAMGYCTFDDVKAVLGEKAAEKVLAFCEKKVRDNFKGEKIT